MHSSMSAMTHDQSGLPPSPQGEEGRVGRKGGWEEGSPTPQGEKGRVEGREVGRRGEGGVCRGDFSNDSLGQPRCSRPWIHFGVRSTVCTCPASSRTWRFSSMTTTSSGEWVGSKVKFLGFKKKGQPQELASVCLFGARNLAKLFL